MIFNSRREISKARKSIPLFFVLFRNVIKNICNKHEREWGEKILLSDKRHGKVILDNYSNRKVTLRIMRNQF